MVYITVSRPLIPKAVTALDASADGCVAVSARGKDNGALVEIWNGASGMMRGSFFVPQEIVRAIQLSPDLQSVVTSGSPGRMRFWRISSGGTRSQISQDFTGGAEEMSCEEADRISRAGKSEGQSSVVNSDPMPRGTDSLNAGGCIRFIRESDFTVSLWRSDSKRRLDRWVGVPPGKLVAATPRPVHLVFKRDPATLFVWDPVKKIETFSMRLPSNCSEIPSMATCSKFDWLALDDGKLTLYDLRSGGILWQCSPGPPMGARVTALLAAVDGRHLVTATLDAVLRVWRIEDGKRLAAFPCDSRIHTMILRGSRLFAGSDHGTVYFLELRNFDFGLPLLELWPDDQGNYFGRCPQCGWTGMWLAEEGAIKVKCQGCKKEFRY